MIYREKGELNLNKYQVDDQEISFRPVKFGIPVRHLSDDIKEEDI